MKKILIVSNGKTLIERERNILSRSDFKVFNAASSEDALNIHRADKMDLIVTDLDLPGICGDKLCSIIRKDDELKHVSIIIICNNNELDIARVSKTTANAYITRPYQPAAFLEKVSDLLAIPERKGYRVVLKVTINGKSLSDSFFCSSHDISASGILIETDKVLEKGDNISCSFYLPQSGRLVIDGEVARVARNENNTFHYGVRYVDLDLKCKSDIEAFIKKRSGKS